MNKNQSKYYNTAICMNQAHLRLLQKKEYDYITIKEICQTAGVNRSTFYLHYENVAELLEETVQNVNREFFEKFSKNSELVSPDGSAAKKDGLYITPEYLQPYLAFVKQNKKIFKLTCEKSTLFQADKTLAHMYKNVFYPVLEKYGVPDEEKPYLFEYYFKGLIAVIQKWVELDCKTDANVIMALILRLLPNPNRDK